MAQHAHKPSDGAKDPWDDTPDLQQLMAEQGVKPVERLEDLLGDFWPEDESIDDFIAAVRRWRREGDAEGQR